MKCLFLNHLFVVRCSIVLLSWGIGIPHKQEIPFCSAVASWNANDN